MRNITFDVKARIQIPIAEHPDIQSLYIFNMYRAGSSVTEAVAQSLAFGSRHTEFNPVQKLDAAGVGLIDHMDYGRHSVYIDANTLSLDMLGSLGGYLYYGFREIPRAYAERFIYTAASVIIARDPRDIAISQYSAVRKHVISGASGIDILRLREVTSETDIDEFLLSEGTIAFIKRITNCYAPLLKRGCVLLRYEEFMKLEYYDIEMFLTSVTTALGSYIQLQMPLAKVFHNLQQRIQNSKALKGHATGGMINLYRSLSPETLIKLNKALEPELKLFGYL
jgi:hypothetical protein